MEVGDKVFGRSGHGTPEKWVTGQIISQTNTRFKALLKNQRGQEEVIEFARKDPRNYGDFAGYREYGGKRICQSDWEALPINDHTQALYDAFVARNDLAKARRQQHERYLERRNERIRAEMVKIAVPLFTPEFFASLPYDQLHGIFYAIGQSLPDDVSKELDKATDYDEADYGGEELL